MSNRPLPGKLAVLVAGDIAISAAAIAAALFIRYAGQPDPAITRLYAFAAPFLVALWLGGLAVFGLYDLRGAKNAPAFLDRISRALVFNLAVTILAFYLVPRFGLTPYLTLALLFILLSTLLLAWRTAVNALFARIAKDRVLFYGWDPEAAELWNLLAENPQLGFLPAGLVDTQNGAAPFGLNPLPRFGPERDLAGIVQDERISVIAVAHHIRKTRPFIRSLFSVVPLGVAVVEFPRLYETVTGKVPVSLIGEAWFLENLIGAKRPKYEFAKRILDLTLALILGVPALLALPFIAMAIMFSTPRGILAYRLRRARPGDGIIFFRQPRVGRNGRVFNFVKFRSQVLSAERLAFEKGGGPDPRAYPMGTLLRKTYLDELPQLWNIFAGDMSFVGPRPERPEFVYELEQQIPFYRTRELVLPGLTGWAQINMEDDASVSDAREKLQYDLSYIKNRSLALDLIIALKTALKLLQRSGR